MALTMLGAPDVRKDGTDEGGPVVTITVQITLTGDELPAAASRLVSGLEALMAGHRGAGHPPAGSGTGSAIAGPAGPTPDRSIALAASPGRGLRLVETGSPMGQPPTLTHDPGASPELAGAPGVRPDGTTGRRIGRGGERAPALRLHTGSRRLLCDGVAVPLTRREFDLFQFFCEHPRRVFSRPQLLRHVWGYDMVGTERTVDVHVRRLRVKLAASAPIIATVRGVGYRLDDDAPVEILIEDR